MASSTGGALASLGEASVHGGGPSAELGTTHRLASSFEERQHLFPNTIARLSHALDCLDSTLLIFTTLPNREKIISIRDELC